VKQLALLLSWQGRIGRKDFWIGLVLTWIATLIVGVTLGAIGDLIHPDAAFGDLIADWAVALLWCWGLVVLGAKRLRDMGQPELIVLLLVPVLLLLAVVWFLGAGLMDVSRVLDALLIPEAKATGIGTALVAMLVFGLLQSLAWIAAVLWLGCTKGRTA
jgi:uncharacterized membrane protein YhaH (DUF805 family)